MAYLVLSKHNCQSSAYYLQARNYITAIGGKIEFLIYSNYTKATIKGLSPKCVCNSKD